MGRKNTESKGEQLLIQRIREGEEHAFEIAFLKYHPSLCRYTWKYVRSEAIAKEIVQEVFMEVWEDRENLKPSGHLRGFLFEVARNKALDYIKHQKIVERYIAEARCQKEERTYKTPFQTNFNNHDFHHALKEAIYSLPPMGRQIFKLNRDEGLTYREIAVYFDISVKTVETHMRRALRKLRERLSEYAPILLLGGIWDVLTYLISKSI